MKVLLQEWMTEDGHKTSISLTEAHLNETIARLKADDRGKPEGRAMEVEIEDDSAFAEMIEGGTVFLEPDELDEIKYPE